MARDWGAPGAPAHALRGVEIGVRVEEKRKKDRNRLKERKKQEPSTDTKEGGRKIINKSVEEGRTLHHGYKRYWRRRRYQTLTPRDHFGKKKN